MTLSQIAAILGLDEVDAVRAVPLTDEELARQAARPRQQNRSERRREKRHLRSGL